MATRSCILAWKIPKTVEPGGLHSIQCKLGQTEQTYTHAHTHTKSTNKHPSPKRKPHEKSLGGKISPFTNSF